MYLYLSPMAGAADSAMRRLCVRYGADGVTTEMISAAAVYYNDRKTFELARIGEGEGPCAVQIFGHDPAMMAHAAAELYARAEIKPVSRLAQWPCQIRLAPLEAPYYSGAKLLCSGSYVLSAEYG